MITMYISHKKLNSVTVRKSSSGAKYRGLALMEYITSISQNVFNTLNNPQLPVGLTLDFCDKIIKQLSLNVAILEFPISN